MGAPVVGTELAVLDSPMTATSSEMHLRVLHTPSMAFRSRVGGASAWSAITTRRYALASAGAAAGVGDSLGVGATTRPSPTMADQMQLRIVSVIPPSVQRTDAVAVPIAS